MNDTTINKYRSPYFSIPKARIPLKVVYDDGGRRAAGFNTKAGDCVARSIAIITERPYAVIHRELTERKALERKCARSITRGDADEGVFTKKAWFSRYMESMGFVWVAALQVGSRQRHRLCEGGIPTGRLVLSLRGHYVASVNGVLRDTWDCTNGGERVVHGWWVYPPEGV